jgi:hypothetical protein
MVCPVGKYMYYPESPAEKWGGTWEQVSGKFLFASDDIVNEDGSITQGAYPLGSEGGSATHTHSFRIGYYPYYGTLSGDDGYGITSWDPTTQRWVSASTNDGMPDSAKINSGTNKGTSSTQPAKRSLVSHTGYEDTLPPYISAYLWLRIE